MKCDQFPWIEYLEHSLNPNDQTKAGAHLRDCKACAAYGKKLEILASAAIKAAPAARLGCPDPLTLAAVEAGGAEPWALEHLEVCAMCRNELDAVKAIEVGARLSAEPLPSALENILATSAENSCEELVGEVMSLVKSRLGGAKPLLDRWRAAIAGLAAGLDFDAAQPCFAAPEQAAAEAAAGPVELKVTAGDMELEIQINGPWLRASAEKKGAPVKGMSLRLENVLGEIVETETDIHGQAIVRDDMPGRRRIVVGT